MQESDIIYILYRTLLGRDPEQNALTFWSEIARTRGCQVMMEGIILSEEARARRMPAASRDLVHIGSRHDLVLKPVEMPGNERGWLALPAHSDDPIVKEYLTGRAENFYMLNILKELAEPGSNVLDLGAHVGTFSIPAALSGYKLISIDANARHAELLEISRRINCLEFMSIIHCAVSDRDCMLAFRDAGLFGSVDFQGVHSGTISVPGRQLISILEEHNFFNLAFIKIDVEGSEMPALSSIAHLLRTPDAPPILYESNEETFSAAGYSVREFRQWLQAAEYKIFRTEGSRWVHAPPEQVQPELWVDLLALKPTHVQKFAHRIEWEWDITEKRQKYLDWARLPYESTRRHLIAALDEEPELLVAYPDLAPMLFS